MESILSADRQWLSILRENCRASCDCIGYFDCLCGRYYDLHHGDADNPVVQAEQTDVAASAAQRREPKPRTQWDRIRRCSGR